MSADKLKNIPLRLFKEYLTYKGLKVQRIKGGHEIWGGPSVKRPVVFQSHIDPVPEFFIRNNLRTLGATPQDFIDFCCK